jgi:hypothetical protein
MLSRPFLRRVARDWDANIDCSSSAAVGRAQESLAAIFGIASMLANRLAEYVRRKDEWDHQANLGTIELKQIDQQLTAAQIRLAIAQKELSNHDQQVDDARDTDLFLRGKFTNQDLFQWMIGQVSGLYFQSYQLAYDLAKRAEMCMQHELGLPYGATSFIRFGYWDSLKKGLLAGEHLAYDLKRLDTAYLDGNVREYELTRHVSLATLAPDQLIALKQTGACELEVPEWLFDIDTPGHYLRRLNSASVTVPCVTGPYTTIPLKAQLLRSSYRQSTDIAVGYDRRRADDPGGPDTRFIDDRKILESIVTSSGQNDAGLFEPTIRNERYLPFEGAGAAGRWRLELPFELRTFDHGTISDVILHLRYTARDGGDQLRTAAKASVAALLASPNGPLARLFSLRHEFPGEWRRFVSSPASTRASAVTVDLGIDRFPYLAQTRRINVTRAQAIGRTSTGAAVQIGIAPGQAAPDPAQAVWSGQATPGPWTLATTADPGTLGDLFVILQYSLSGP